MDKAHAQDAAAILALRHLLEEWLEANGVEQWRRSQVALVDVEQQIAAGEWHVLRSASGGLRAALRLLWSDEPVWHDRNAYAAYVHGLMVSRTEAGCGLGAALLSWAEQQACHAGAPALRLDCLETNAVLRDYYRTLRFQEVGRQDFEDGPSSVLWERAVRREW